MHPIMFYIGNDGISSWLIFALIGIWSAYFILLKSLSKQNCPEWQINVFVLGGALVWFCGAYFGETLTVGRSEAFIANNGKIILNGFVLYGGLLATFLYGLAIWYFTPWRKKVRLSYLWNYASIALLSAFFWGRIGCTLYGCCYGTPAGKWPGYALAPYSHSGDQDRVIPKNLIGIKLHPTPFYEAVGIVGVLIAIALYYQASTGNTKRILSQGVLGWLCWMGYGGVRFITEFIRMDPRGKYVFGFSPSQWIAVIMILVGVFEVRRAILLKQD